MPSYSGGLAFLRRHDSRRRDLRLPMVAVSLLYRKDFHAASLRRRLADRRAGRVARGRFLTEEPARASVPLEDRRVELRCWRYEVKGVRGFEVPVYFLDADLPSNAEADRALTGTLYGGDSYYRLRQEVLLGIGRRAHAPRDGLQRPDRVTT